jgi:hypothetical protein
MSKTTPFNKPDFSSLADRWPSPFVSRGEVERFTGGIISIKYLANLDSQGAGPQGRVRVGRKIAYNVRDLINWLENRAEMVENHEPAR